jgi:hypothetical protein
MISERMQGILGFVKFNINRNIRQNRGQVLERRSLVSGATWRRQRISAKSAKKNRGVQSKKKTIDLRVRSKKID